MRPQPLRSSEFPNGFPWLASTDKIRVLTANSLYEFVAGAVRLADSLGIAWSIENPRSSLFWETTYIRDLINYLAYLDHVALWTEFQNCAFGGARPKWSAFLHNLPVFHELEVNGKCKNDHQHKPWGSSGGGFATSEETAYPAGLCLAIANLVSRHFSELGVVIKPVPISVIVPTATGLISAEAGKQARGHKAPRLIPEYSGIVKFTTDEGGFDQALEGQVLKTALHTRDGVIPAGSKILRTKALDGGVRALFAGIPWNKHDFLKHAKTVLHPVDSTAFLGDDVYSNIWWILTHSPGEVRQFRESQMAKLISWNKELEVEEKSRHDKLPHESERILCDKKVLLFARLLEDVGYKDKLVSERVFSGFQLSGELEKSNVFAERDPKNQNPISKDDLMKASCWSRHVIASTVCSSGDVQMDKEIYDITMTEAKLGWLTGPISMAELDAKFNSRWIAARRFGVRQGDKIRPIDDFSAHGQNSTVVTGETIPLGGVDAIMCMAKWMVGAVHDDRSISVPDGKGGWAASSLHKDWSVSQARSIVGRCVDLKSAYKQLLRHKSDSALSIIAVWNPIKKCVELYETEALPFGSTGSVYGFNRCSVALRAILIRFFKILCTSFFDDFPCIEYQCLASSAGRITEQLFEQLGWSVATDKLKEFSQSFDAVGVTFDLRGVPTKGALVVQNTVKRRESIVQEIDKFISSGFMAIHEAASLRGRMQYGEAQHWGRILSLSSRHLAIRANGGGCGIVAGELHDILLVAKWLISNAPPRMLYPWSVEQCNLIFVDGAADTIDESGTQRVSIGGVLFSPRLSRPQYFGMELSSDVVAHWQSEGSRQVIAQGELLPVYVAKKLWPMELSHARNLFFIDNESAREALIRNYSPSWSSREIILRVKILDSKLSSLDWYGRVPTMANWADGPSRLKFGEMESIDGERVHVDKPKLCDLTGASVRELLSA